MELVVEVLLYVHRKRRLIRGREPRTAQSVRKYHLLAQIQGHITSQIAWRREAWKEEALDDFH